jgi:hypothetical protein
VHFSAKQEAVQAANQACAAAVAAVSHAIWSAAEDTRRWYSLDDPKMPTLHGGYKVPNWDGKGGRQLHAAAGVPTTYLLTDTSKPVVRRAPRRSAVAGPPKSAADARVVALPAMLIDAMKRHLAEFSAEDEGLIFRGPLGASLRRNNFHRSARWSQSVVQAGLPAGFHFHDLRHTGNNLAAASGASTRELMHRVGHGTMGAALIYQYATGEWDREIADALQFRIERELKEI